MSRQLISKIELEPSRQTPATKSCFRRPLPPQPPGPGLQEAGATAVLLAKRPFPFLSRDLWLVPDIPQDCFIMEGMNREGEDFYYMHVLIEVVADDPETLARRGR